ncbi:MAG: hypothetical protein Q7T50_07870, partial [Candidatus Magasanikbacteria bacterium]|nr:hypothetical protein [Candidatus Magasanikbacteria bacterium]
MKKLLITFAIFVVLVSGACGKEMEQKKAQVEKAGKVANLATKSFLPSPYVGKIRPLRCLSNSLILVQFNGLNFGKSKSAEELEFMARMFRDADLIVIEEVSTDGTGARAISQLADYLNRTGNKWLYSDSDSTHQSSKKEKYGYLWNDSRIHAVREKPTLISSLSGVLMREPAKMTFIFNGKSFDVFSFHLVPTKDKPINEVVALSRNPEIFSANNVFVVGDFNLDHQKMKNVFEDRLGFRHQIEGRTSLKKSVVEG